MEYLLQLIIALINSDFDIANVSIGVSVFVVIFVDEYSIVELFGHLSTEFSYSRREGGRNGHYVLCALINQLPRRLMIGLHVHAYMSHFPAKNLVH